MNTNPLYCDSFDSDTSLAHLYDTVLNVPAIGLAYGRNGTQGARFPANTAVFKNLPTLSSFYCGFAINCQSGSFGNVFAVLDSTTDWNSAQFTIYIDATGHISAFRSSTLLGTSTLALSFGVWHYIEIHGVISNTVGVVEVKVDGIITFLSLAGQNTQLTANARFTAFGLGHPNANPGNAGGEVWIDDFYFLDAAGTAPNGYTGDTIVRYYPPSGAGSNTQWTPNGAAQNYQCVDEVPPDDDTTYNSSAVVGKVDTFVHAALPGTVTTIAAAMVRARVRNDSGSPVIHLAIKSGASLGESGDIAVPTAYADVVAPFPTDPATGVAWNAAGLNACEVGYKQTA